MGYERILIVEDEYITGEGIRHMVYQFGYEPIGPVASGKDAIASALAHGPDVILMDIQLKGPMNGIQAAEAIRAQSRCPVIYVTANSDQLRTRGAVDTGSFGPVLKPINEQELLAAIKKALNQPRAESAPRAWPPVVHEL
ncbi:MAG TPA: response regulator [Syntrophorhabdales bacterium]|nr:response regulator [Syntrophorhabdales bacterium]